MDTPPMESHTGISEDGVVLGLDCSCQGRSRHEHPPPSFLVTLNNVILVLILFLIQEWSTCYLLLAVMNKAVVNICVPDFVWTCACLCFCLGGGRKEAREGLTLWEPSNCAQEWLSILHSTRSLWGIHVSHVYQHLMLSVFVIVAFLRGLPWCLCVVLIFISPPTHTLSIFFLYL